MQAAGERLAKAAEQRPGRSDLFFFRRCSISADYFLAPCCTLQCHSSSNTRFFRGIRSAIAPRRLITQLNLDGQRSPLCRHPYIATAAEAACRCDRPDLELLVSHLFFRCRLLHHRAATVIPSSAWVPLSSGRGPAHQRSSKQVPPGTARVGASCNVPVDAWQQWRRLHC